MIIDCDRCAVRGAACANCAVTFVATTTTGAGTFAAARDQSVVELDAAEIHALAALANAGMIPPLRYAPPMAKACLCNQIVIFCGIG